MSYSLAPLWYERQRFLPGVLAVGFSALLIALQCGLLLGLFSIVLNYMNLLPGATSNWYLIAGIGLIAGGFVTATQLR